MRRGLGDHGGGRAAGELAVGLGHVDGARLEATGHQLQLLANVVKPIQGVEEALARNLEHMVDALRHQGIRQDASAKPGGDARLAHLSQLHSISPAQKPAGDHWPPNPQGG